MEYILEVLKYMFSLQGILLLVVGVAVGILGGAMPGISSTMTVALISTMTYGMEPLPAITLLAACAVGSTYGGSISATVLNIPGTPASAATAMEGNPLTRQGHGSMALSINAISSAFGNTVGVVLLLITMPVMTAISMKFGTQEMFWFAIFGVVICAQLSKGDFIKGLIGAVLGLLLGCVGLDPIYGVARYTFGSTYLADGIPLIPAMVGVFGMSEVFKMLTDPSIEPVTVKQTKFFEFKEFWKYKWTALRVSIMGFLIGAIPGVGSNVASWVGYDHAKSSSKNPERFGNGAVDGLVGSEAANNACVPGTYAPLLSLGVPGDGVTAIVLGVLIMQGVQPGPTFISKNPSWLYQIALAMFLAGIVFLILGVFVGRGIIKMLGAPMPVIMAIVTILCIVGSYGYNNCIQDVYLMFFFGLLGYLMSKFKFPSAPLILGIILGGSMVDKNFRRGLVTAKMDFTVFLTRPICIVMIILILFLLFQGFVRPALKRRKEQKDAASGE